MDWRGLASEVVRAKSLYAYTAAAGERNCTESTETAALPGGFQHLQPRHIILNKYNNPQYCALTILL